LNKAQEIKVLIAEDDVTTRLLISAVLKKNGYTVEECETGTEALQKLRTANPPKIVVMDWLMPQMNGLDVIKHIRRQNPPHTAYIIMLTIKREQRDILTSLQSGANDYLMKPFNAQDLLARVNVAYYITKLEEAISEINAESQEFIKKTTISRIMKTQQKVNIK
jgi:DNA-binding response OmpR family regulator